MLFFRYRGYNAYHRTLTFTRCCILDRKTCHIFPSNYRSCNGELRWDSLAKLIVQRILSLMADTSKQNSGFLDEMNSFKILPVRKLSFCPLNNFKEVVTFKFLVSTKYITFL